MVFMNEIVVKLTPAADVSLLQRAFENMKGVFSVPLRKTDNDEEKSASSEWLDKLHEIKREINPSVIDMDDDRTKYIMSK